MPHRDSPVSACYKCFLIFHANKHWCPECGEPSPRGVSHLNKLQDKDRAELIKLEASIHESLDNATENGNAPLALSVDENVQSLMSYDSVCDSLQDEQIRPHVESYFRKHRKGYVAKDGTLMDEHGNRSIFDDVDK